MASQDELLVGWPMAKRVPGPPPEPYKLSLVEGSRWCLKEGPDVAK
jgi:hypothetical protein